MNTGLFRYSCGNCRFITPSLKHVITRLVVNVHRWLATPTHSRAQTAATLPTATAAATRPTIATPRTDPLSCLTTYKRTMTRRYQTTLSSTISKPTNRHWQHTQLFTLLSKLIIWHFLPGNAKVIWNALLQIKICWTTYLLRILIKIALKSPKCKKDSGTHFKLCIPGLLRFLWS